MTETRVINCDGCGKINPNKTITARVTIGRRDVKVLHFCTDELNYEAGVAHGGCAVKFSKLMSETPFKETTT